MKNYLKGTYFHHTAYARGYIKKHADEKVEEYNGRYGKGYKVYTHNPNSTNYCFVSYYIFNNKDQ